MTSLSLLTGKIPMRRKPYICSIVRFTKNNKPPAPFTSRYNFLKFSALLASMYRVSSKSSTMYCAHSCRIASRTRYTIVCTEPKNSTPANFTVMMRFPCLSSTFSSSEVRAQHERWDDPNRIDFTPPVELNRNKNTPKAIATAAPIAMSIDLRAIKNTTQNKSKRYSTELILFLDLINQSPKKLHPIVKKIPPKKNLGTIL
mmetsp:Transcript_17171/g.28720  ORF Transcript_17171/g.28720 Transcript_17171/m.28720 type:complete len:201 (-) Transcript_17171:1409-2011(-)